MGSGYTFYDYWYFEPPDKPEINHLAHLEEQLERDGIRAASDRHTSLAARPRIAKRRRRPRRRERVSHGLRTEECD